MSTQYSKALVWTHELITACTCFATDRLLVSVSPRTSMLVTRAISGGCTVTFRRLSTKIISAYLAGLTFRLLARDHNSTLSNFDSCGCQHWWLEWLCKCHQQIWSLDFPVWLISRCDCLKVACIDNIRCPSNARSLYDAGYNIRCPSNARSLYDAGSDFRHSGNIASVVRTVRMIAAKAEQPIIDFIRHI